MATLDSSGTGAVTSERGASTPSPDGVAVGPSMPQPMATSDLSVLFDCPHEPERTVRATDVFHDLHLDDIVATITAGREEYDLAPFFAHPVDRLATVRYRQDAVPRPGRHGALG